MAHVLRSREMRTSRATVPAMRIAIYLVVVAGLAGIAWHYPFLFELPVIAAIGGAYWAFFAKDGDNPQV